ncbi:type III-A CRISPR-associated protein Cas10/Csm1 [Methanopyrus kandleri]
MERVALAGLLHDVGKLPQRAGEPGNHQDLGAELLKKALGGREREDETLGLAVLAARYHHSDSLGEARPGDLEVPEDWGLELAVVALADTLASAERENELDREEPKGDHRGYWTLYNPWYRIWEAFRRRLGDDVPDGWSWTEGRPEFVPDELPLLHLNVDPREFELPEVVQGGEGYRGRYRELAGRLAEWLEELGVRDHPHPFDPARVAMEVTTSLVPAQHYVPEGRDHMRSITLYDHSLLTASLAACLWYLVEEGHLDGPEDDPSVAYNRLRDGLREGRGSFLLVRGSLSGIGEFIRSVRRASPPEEGRRPASYLKIVRGRSAFVDLLTAGAAWTVLRETMGRDAHPAFLLRAAGGSFTLLLPSTEEVREALEVVREGLKRSVSEGSDGVLSFGMAWVELGREDLVRRERFRERVEELGRRESADKRRAVLPGRRTSRVEEPCPVCGSPVPEGGGCEHCERLGDLGGSLVRRDEEDRPVFAGFLVYEDRGGPGDGGAVVYERDGHRYLVHHVTRGGLGGAVSVGGLLLVDPAHVRRALEASREVESPARVVMSYFPWYAATKDDVPESEGEEGIATFSGMAERSPGASLLGFAYVDVDNLGEWVKEAAGDAFGTLLSVSRFTDLVFRHWVNALGFRTVAELLDDVPGLEVRLADGERELDPLELLPRFGEDGEPEPEHWEDRGRPFLLAYSGGDDLLVVGAWNEAYSLPFEVFLLFSHVTGYLPVASLSGAVVLTRRKAPFHLILRALKDREREAKRAGEGDDPVRVRLAPKGYVSLLRLSVSESWNVGGSKSGNEDSDTHPVPGPVRLDLALAAVDMLKDVMSALDRKARAYRLLRALRSWWERGDVGAASALAYVVSRMEDDSGVDLSGTLLSVLPVGPTGDAELYPVGLLDVALIPYLIARRGG